MIKALINPLSLACSEGELKGRLANIRKFRLLVDAIAPPSGPILCHCKPNALEVGGFNIHSLHGLPQGFTREATELLRGMLNHLQYEEAIANCPDTFTFEDFDPSHELGFAYAHGFQTLSFTFDHRFAVSQLIGIYNELSGTALTNFHRHTTLDVEALWVASPEECARHKAHKEPLWNQEATQRYLDNVPRPFPAHDKRNCNLRHGHIVALINGWTFDRHLTDLNSSSAHIRRIYNSQSLGGQTSFISIDIEKTDIHFETFDSDGQHLGEIDWQGNRTGTPKSSHNITV